MVGCENPRPAPVARQSSLGPPAGHSGSNPRSWLTPSRRGPRNCGQPVSGEAMSSARAPACAAPGVPPAAASTIQNPRAVHLFMRDDTPAHASLLADAPHVLLAIL